MTQYDSNDLQELSTSELQVRGSGREAGGDWCGVDQEYINRGVGGG